MKSRPAWVSWPARGRAAFPAPTLSSMARSPRLYDAALKLSPRDAGAMVTFTACPFTADYPEQREGQPSQLFAVGKNLFYFCLGRDQLFTFRGPDRQLYLFAAAAGRNRRGNAISVFRVGFHGVVEQYGVAAFQRYAQRRGRFDTEELKINAGRLGRQIDQDVLVRMRHVAH